MNEFVIGEYVERKMDGALGVVKKISEYDGSFTYLVDLGREPMEGFVDDCWWGSDLAWRRHFRTHAHVYTTSQDCDGKYERSHVDVPSTLERTDAYGDLLFKERVLGSVVSLHAEGATLTVYPGRLFWSQQTDEGYIHTEVVWCDEDDQDQPDTYRDHTAESMGY